MKIFFWSLFVILPIILVTVFSDGSDNNYIIACYYTDWSSSRDGKGKYMPADISGAPCTHIIYSFAKLNDDTKDSFEPFDKDLAINKGFYQKVTDLSNQGYTIILSAGGWTESLPKYSEMMADVELRNHAAQQLAEFLVENNFCGFNFDLEYPGAYQGDINAEYAEDKENFVKFLQALRLSFDEKMKENPHSCPLSLSVAVSANEKIVDVAYDVPAIVGICDWVAVMTYDFFVSSDGVTGFVSPFESVPGTEGAKQKFNVKDAMQLWIDRGAPACKLLVGFPTYGRSFALDSAEKHGILAPATGTPQPGKFTKESGTLAFYEIIDNVCQDNYNVVHQPNIESYAYEGLNWVSYDDKLDAAVKADYIKQNNFGGASIWSLDNECFQEDCPTGKYPIIQTIHDILNDVTEVDAVKNIT